MESEYKPKRIGLRLLAMVTIVVAIVAALAFVQFRSSRTATALSDIRSEAKCSPETYQELVDLTTDLGGRNKLSPEGKRYISLASSCKFNNYSGSKIRAKVQALTSGASDFGKMEILLSLYSPPEEMLRDLYQIPGKSSFPDQAILDLSISGSKVSPDTMSMVKSISSSRIDSLYANSLYSARERLRKVARIGGIDERKQELEGYRKDVNAAFALYSTYAGGDSRFVEEFNGALAKLSAASDQVTEDRPQTAKLQQVMVGQRIPSQSPGLYFYLGIILGRYEEGRVIFVTGDQDLFSGGRASVWLLENGVGEVINGNGTKSWFTQYIVIDPNIGERAKAKLRSEIEAASSLVDRRLPKRLFNNTPANKVAARPPAERPAKELACSETDLFRQLSSDVGKNLEPSEVAQRLIAVATAASRDSLLPNWLKPIDGWLSSPMPTEMCVVAGASQWYVRSVFWAHNAPNGYGAIAIDMSKSEAYFILAKDLPDGTIQITHKIGRDAEVLALFERRLLIGDPNLPLNCYFTPSECRRARAS